MSHFISRRSIVWFLLQAVLWCGLTIAVTGLFVVTGPFDLQMALRMSAANWLPWVLFTPLVFWLAGRYPLERGALRRHVPVHLGGGFAIALLSLGFTVLALPPLTEGGVGLPGPSRFEPPPGAPPWPGSPPGEPGMPWLIPLILRGNFGLSIYLIVLSAAHALAYHRRAEERDRHALKLAADLHRARLDSLRLQLQPHFLFNTLNAISAFVGRSPARADELINALGGLLRASLETHDDEVPLVREMELLERYLTIEQSRLGRRLRVVREVAGGLDVALVPPLLLQPLAENAIRHGIEPRIAPGTLTIRVERDERQLRLVVADDGIGLAPQGSERGRLGVGLENTVARLRTLYGEDAQFEIIAPTAGGVRVEIRLPFHTEPVTQSRNRASTEP